MSAPRSHSTAVRVRRRNPGSVRQLSWLHSDPFSSNLELISVFTDLMLQEVLVPGDMGTLALLCDPTVRNNRTTAPRPRLSGLSCVVISSLSRAGRLPGQHSIKLISFHLILS